MGYNKVEKWRNKLDFYQSVVHQDSDSPLASEVTNTTLQNLVGPNDSASNVSEVVSESNLQNLESNVVNKVYDITDPGVLNLYMHDETIDFEVIDNVN